MEKIPEGRQIALRMTGKCFMEEKRISVETRRKSREPGGREEEGEMMRIPGTGLCFARKQKRKIVSLNLRAHTGE